jgi:hypothetical protein
VVGTTERKIVETKHVDSLVDRSTLVDSRAVQFLEAIQKGFHDTMITAMMAITQRAPHEKNFQATAAMARYANTRKNSISALLNELR